MDAAAALADLTEISSQVETAVVLDADGAVVASTHGSPEPAERLAGAARELLEVAAETGVGGGRELSQIEVALREGSVFVVRDGRRTLAATTAPAPTSALVLYDLRTCLRTLAAGEETEAPKPKRRRPRKAAGA